MSPKFINF